MKTKQQLKSLKMLKDVYRKQQPKIDASLSICCVSPMKTDKKWPKKV